MPENDDSPKHMTSAELAEAIRRHREYTRKLLAEVRSRRADLSRTDSMQSADVAPPTNSEK